MGELVPASAQNQIALVARTPEQLQQDAERRQKEADELEVKLKFINEQIPSRMFNVSGSSAGAGSGDFHQYRMVKRHEQMRLKRMDEEWALKKEEEEFEARKKQRQEELESKQTKKRAKRLKKKEKKKKKARTNEGVTLGPQPEGGAGKDSDSSDSEDEADKVVQPALD